MFTFRKDGHAQDAHPLARWCLGTCHNVGRVNSRSFYVYTDGATVRRLRVEWRSWLAQLQVDGWAWLLESDDDPRGWRRLRPLPPDPAALGADLPGFEASPLLVQRDQRFQRAVRQVLGRYRLDRVDEPGRIVVTIHGGDQDYRVVARLDWAEGPRCSCPDATHRLAEHGGFCKHTVAVLLTWPDLRCQLLSAFL